MIVALVAQKGGSGKSTLAAMLAAEGVARGLRVLVVDADPQATLRTWAGVGAEGPRPTPTVVAMDGTMARPEQLPRLAPQFDLVLVDTPGRVDTTLRAALMVADLAVVPCSPSAADTWSLVAVARLLEEARTLRPEVRAVLALNRVRTGTAIGRAARTALDGVGLPVLGAALSDRVAFQEALAGGQGVVTYAPSTPADLEVRRLFDEVVNGQADSKHRTPPGARRETGRVGRGRREPAAKRA